MGLLSLDHSDDSEWVEESKEGECGCGIGVGKCEISLMQIISGLWLLRVVAQGILPHVFVEKIQLPDLLRCIQDVCEMSLLYLI